MASTQTFERTGMHRSVASAKGPSRFPRAFVVLALAVLAMASRALAGGPQERDADQVTSAMPARIEIVTAPEGASYRSAVRLFATSVQREFHSVLGFPYPGAGSPAIRIEVGFPRPFAMDVTHRIYRTPSGGARGVVVIPDPPSADFASIRLAIVATIFKTALYSRAGDIRKVSRPPVWFVRGLALHSDPGERLRLFDAAYSSWSHANLPSIGFLLATNSPVLAHPAVAAQIAAWCTGKGNLTGRWEKLLDHLAGGGEWDASALGAIFRDIDALPELDDDFNLWLANRPQHILAVGSTGPTTLLRLRSQLLIYPWESDIDYLLSGFPAKGLPLAACLAHADREEVRSVLQDRIQRFHLLAIGRDPLFQGLCGAYISALDSALEPDHIDEALPLWKEAERKRLDLETRLATGEILK